MIEPCACLVVGLTSVFPARHPVFSDLFPSVRQHEEVHCGQGRLQQHAFAPLLCDCCWSAAFFADLWFRWICVVNFVEANQQAAKHIRHMLYLNLVVDFCIIIALYDRNLEILRWPLMKMKLHVRHFSVVQEEYWNHITSRVQRFWR